MLTLGANSRECVDMMPIPPAHSKVAQDGRKLMAVSCLSLPSGRITGMNDHAQLVFFKNFAFSQAVVAHAFISIGAHKTIQ